MRIPFIDIAKGISILLVVMVHVGVPEPFIGAYAAKVPIFFFLAGLFFLKSVNRGGYLTKKVKSILIPFSIYYICSYILFYTLVSIKPDVIIGDNNSFAIGDLFTQRNLFNGPLWFLLALFEVEAAFFLVFTFVSKEWIRACIVFSFAIIGFIFSLTDTFLPLWLDSSCVALMYFYFGYIFSKTNFVTKTYSIPILFAIAIISYILFLIMPVSIGMSTNYYSNCILAVTSGSLIILFILVISKIFSKLTILGWFGTNSLIILCTHHIIYRPIKYFQIKLGMENPIVLFIATIVIEIAVVYIISRYIPILAGKYKSSKNHNHIHSMHNCS